MAFFVTTVVASYYSNYVNKIILMVYYSNRLCVDSEIMVSFSGRGFGACWVKLNQALISQAFYVLA